jgi:hypothetical protein
MVDEVAYERAIDAELADSFPASDPPSWTSGVAETRPRGTPPVPPEVEPRERSVWVRRISSAAALIAVVWAVPLLVVGLPLALAWRALLSATKWRAP